MKWHVVKAISLRTSAVLSDTYKEGLFFFLKKLVLKIISELKAMNQQLCVCVHPQRTEGGKIIPLCIICIKNNIKF